MGPWGLYNEYTIKISSEIYSLTKNIYIGITLKIYIYTGAIGWILCRFSLTARKRIPFSHKEINSQAMKMLV